MILSIIRVCYSSCMPENPFEKWRSSPPPAQSPEKSSLERRESLFWEMALATRGKNNRIKNEDTGYIDPERGIFFVADGVGGTTRGGEQASKATAEAALKSTIEKDNNETIRNVFGAETKPLTRDEVEEGVRLLIGERMRDRVARYGGTSDTTLSFGKLWTTEEGKERVTIGNAGDSRIYRLRKGALEQLTEDDSMIQKIIDYEMPDADGFPIVDDKNITTAVRLETLKEYGAQDRDFLRMLTYAKRIAEEEDREVDRLTLEEMRHFVLETVHHARHLDIQTHNVEAEDVFVAMSDGIHDNLTDREISEIIETHLPDTERIGDALIEAAIAVSKDETNPRHKADDMTVTVVLHKAKEEERK